MKTLFTWLIKGLKSFLLWAFLQYAFVFVCQLISCLTFGRFSGSHSVYSFSTGYEDFVMVSTFAYSVWYAIRRTGRPHWTLVFPVIAVVLCTLASIAEGLDWNIKIMSIDDYMLGCLSTLILVPAFQYAALVIHKKKFQPNQYI